MIFTCDNPRHPRETGNSFEGVYITVDEIEEVAELMLKTYYELACECGYITDTEDE